MHVKSGVQYSSLLQQNVLEPLYVGLVAIKLVNRRTFWAKSSGMVKHRSSYFTEADATVLSEEKGDCLTDCP